MREGDLVFYTLTADDAERIRLDRESRSISGNPLSAGQTYPAMIVRKWTETTANLQVFLDGPDQAWVTSRVYGTENGTYRDYNPTAVAVPEPVAQPEAAPVDQPAAPSE
jgi:hypothetical protein